MEQEWEQDDAGIAMIEDFLDKIEDPLESILDSFQEDFDTVKAHLDLKDEDGSNEYLKNRARAGEFATKVP